MSGLRIQTPDEAFEEDLDRSLRPRTLQDFIGQDGLKDQLSVSLEAARLRGEALDHVLLAGPPGLGKTSLAQILAAELEVPFVQTAGPAVALLHPRSATPSFTAPEVTRETALAFRVIVTDNGGAKGSDVVKVTVRNVRRK